MPPSRPARRPGASPAPLPDLTRPFQPGTRVAIMRGPFSGLVASSERLVSKQDSHFFNIFGLVLGILIAIAIVLFGLARAVGSSTQGAHVYEDGEYLASVDHRIAPPVRVAVAGQDNTALAIVEKSSAASGSALPVPKDGTEVYETACKACHGAGIGGAPKSGDKAAWGPRLAQGNATLYKHAIEGLTGKSGVMPPKGGRVDLSDDLIKSAVDHMVELNR